MQNGQDVSLGAEETSATQTASTTENGTDRVRGTVTRNPVMVAMSRISNILDGFDGATQHRILGFLAEQYGLVE